MNFINNTVNTENINQTTLKNKVIFSGVGIHNGKAVTMSIEPAEINTGIVFERVDIKNKNIIEASIKNIDESSLCSKITNKFGISVSTIEHLMAALLGLCIDNAKIKINSAELPAMDGSSHEYTKRIIESGTIEQDLGKKFLKLVKKVSVYDNNRYISITPAEELSINIEINYPNTIIGNDKFLYKHSTFNFINEISRSRTFALAEDINKMRTTGLAIGGNLNNAIVVDKYKILNKSGLRFDNEFIKHKVLDCLGDFYLIGMPLLGNIECYAPGHKLNHKFIKKILEDPSNYEIRTKYGFNKTDNYYSLLENHNDNIKKTNAA
jgi:UDP-3-O-[3-hydroxymyristoyl] N-acetylglucosamine deacetylase